MSVDGVSCYQSVRETYPCVSQWRCCLWGEPSSCLSWSVLSSGWAHEQTSNWEIWKFGTSVSTYNMHNPPPPPWTHHFNPRLTHHSPPGHIGLHYLHHSYRGFVDFDEGPAEDLPQPQHLDDLHHFGTDTFNPNRRGSSMFTKQERWLIVGVFNNTQPQLCFGLLKQVCWIIDHYRTQRTVISWINCSYNITLKPH